MKKYFLSGHLDFYGFLASALCAIHCALVPIILAFGTLGSLAWLGEHWVEELFIVISIIIASWSLIGSYRRQHRNVLPLLIVLSGFALLLLGHGLAGTPKAILSVLGGCSIAFAHFYNWTLLRTRTARVA